MSPPTTHTHRLCDLCSHVGPLERERCPKCDGPTWEIFEAQGAIGRAMNEIRRFGWRLHRCPCCSMFYLAPPGSPAKQCDCGAMYRAHPDAA